MHQTNRLDANLERHHHLVCVRCQRLTDFYGDRLDKARALEGSPGGFQVLNYQVEAYGRWPDCRAVSAH